MSSQANMEAYASVELLSSYPTRESLVAYRATRIARYAPVAEFIRARTQAAASVVEIGSGSSALLYALAGRGLLASGLGVELSASRWEFAEAWKKDDGYDAVRNVKGNFTDVDFAQGVSDWFIVIDNTFTYLYPENPDYPRDLLMRASKSLKPGGRVLLDFINYAKRASGIDYRQWVAFDPMDPFGYGLYSNRIDDEINRSETIWLKRDGSESRKVEYCKVYSLDALTRLLSECGLKVEEVAATFTGDAFVPGESDRMVVVGRKK